MYHFRGVILVHVMQHLQHYHGEEKREQSAKRREIDHAMPYAHTKMTLFSLKRQQRDKRKSDKHKVFPK